ncbi:uncharacterized protein TNCV_3447521 [Trichonephila clavipes]|nr:uncharacterized protein TNCV_3447521 [Trichonephila clavipes]
MHGSENISIQKNARKTLTVPQVVWKCLLPTFCGTDQYLTTMRYTTILCDGDAKTHQHLNEKKVYEDDVAIEKEECVKHVAKRLGIALRNKVKEWRVKSVKLGGLKLGILTDTTITKLQNFYRKAIVDNVPEVDNMKTSILATLFHCMSTDAKPMPSKCPEGKLS